MQKDDTERDRTILTAAAQTTVLCAEEGNKRDQLRRLGLETAQEERDAVARRDRIVAETAVATAANRARLHGARMGMCLCSAHIYTWACPGHTQLLLPWDEMDTATCEDLKNIIRAWKEFEPFKADASLGGGLPLGALICSRSKH